MFFNLIRANLSNRQQILSFPNTTEDSRPNTALIPVRFIELITLHSNANLFWITIKIQTCIRPAKSLKKVMPWKAGAEDSIVRGLLSRYSLLRRRAHGGSLLQTCVPNTLSFQV